MVVTFSLVDLFRKSSCSASRKWVRLLRSNSYSGCRIYNGISVSKSHSGDWCISRSESFKHR